MLSLITPQLHPCAIASFFSTAGRHRRFRHRVLSGDSPADSCLGEHLLDSLYPLRPPTWTLPHPSSPPSTTTPRRRRLASPARSGRSPASPATLVCSRYPEEAHARANSPPHSPEHRRPFRPHGRPPLALAAPPQSSSSRVTATSSSSGHQGTHFELRFRLRAAPSPATMPRPEPPLLSL